MNVKHINKAIYYRIEKFEKDFKDLKKKLIQEIYIYIRKPGSFNNSSSVFISVTSDLTNNITNASAKTEIHTISQE